MLPLLLSSTPPCSIWWWERPANPHLFNLHTREELTHAMAEKYRGTNRPPATSWLAELLALEALEGVDVLRHQLRIRKSRESSWDDCLPLLREVLQADDSLWQEATLLEERRRSWTLPESLAQPDEIQAYEGVTIARSHPLAKGLFALPGLTLARFQKRELLCKRSPAFSWEELSPGIESLLETHS